MTEESTPPTSSIALIPKTHGAMVFAPKTLGEAMEFAKMLADSSLVPRDFRGKPGDVLVAMQYGMEVGLSPLQAVQSVAVINGRPAMWGDAVLGVVQASGLLEDIEEEFIRENGRESTAEQVYAVCRVKRRGAAKHTERRFSWADAVRAGLHNKDTYKQYPQRMLPMRARAWALRDTFADVLRGLQVREEVDDYNIVDVTPAEQKPAAAAEDLMPRKRADVAPPSPGAQEAAPAAAGNSDAVPAAEDTRASQSEPVVETSQDVGSPTDSAPGPEESAAGATDAPAGELFPNPEVTEPALPSPSPRITFNIGPKLYETNGITKIQLLQCFKLSEAVDKKAKSALAMTILKKEFKLEHRTDLTEEDASKYIVRLNECLEG